MFVFLPAKLKHSADTNKKLLRYFHIFAYFYIQIEANMHRKEAFYRLFSTLKAKIYTYFIIYR